MTCCFAHGVYLDLCYSLCTRQNHDFDCKEYCGGECGPCSFYAIIHALIVRGSSNCLSGPTLPLTRAQISAEPSLRPVDAPMSMWSSLKHHARALRREKQTGHEDGKGRVSSGALAGQSSVSMPALDCGNKEHASADPC